MKLTKSDLKAIVKECLVEIMNEGLAGTSTVSSPALTRNQGVVASRPLSESVKKSPRPSPQLREAIMREAGGDKIMESILADTAASTLPKFLQAGDGRVQMPAVGGGLVEQVVAQTNPEDLFGEDVTSKWASLAFVDSPTKK